jgi:predicted nucleic acid-binding Zn ribbon protein
MPTYVYEVLLEDGTAGEQFEVVEKMSDEPLTVHPETGQPVRRVFLPFSVAGKHGSSADKNLADDSKLEKLGFTKYVKSDEGKYDKVIGKGPSHLQK